MDFSWLIIFIIISIASTLLSKRKEKQEAERRAREQAGKPPKPSPATGPPPVAPGPFGPLWKPAPPEPPSRPQPVPAMATDEEDAEKERPEPQPVVPARPLFKEMQRELDERAAKTASVPSQEPVFVPENWKREAQPRPVQKMFAADIDAHEGESFSRRVVADVAPSAPVHRAKRFGIGRGDLKRAVVMAEILDKPVALRDSVPRETQF